MAQEEGGRLPGGMGGLITYYDEYEEPFQLDPKTVVLMITMFIGIEVFLHWQGIGL